MRIVRPAAVPPQCSCNQGKTDSQSGAVYVEFSLMLTLLFLLVTAIVDYGAIFFIQNNMYNASREATRRLAVGAMNTTQAETYAQTFLVNWNLPFTVTAQDDGTDVSVDITVPASDAAFLNLFNIASFGNIRAIVTMRKE